MRTRIIRLHRGMLIAAASIAALAVAAGVAYATIPDSAGVIHACYKKSGGSLKVIDSAVVNCKKDETSLNWSVQGPTGAPGPGVDWTTVYEVDSAIGTVVPTLVGTVNAECNNGDVAVGGNFGVNGPSSFSVYFAGTHIIPANIGSATLNAGYYGFSVKNDNAVNIIIFATVLCVPA